MLTMCSLVVHAGEKMIYYSLLNSQPLCGAFKHGCCTEHYFICATVGYPRLRRVKFSTTPFFFSSEVRNHILKWHTAHPYDHSGRPAITSVLGVSVAFLAGCGWKFTAVLIYPLILLLNDASEHLGLLKRQAALTKSSANLFSRQRFGALFFFFFLQRRNASLLKRSKNRMGLVLLPQGRILKGFRLLKGNGDCAGTVLLCAAQRWRNLGPFLLRLLWVEVLICTVSITAFKIQTVEMDTGIGFHAEAQDVVCIDYSFASVM